MDAPADHAQWRQHWPKSGSELGPHAGIDRERHPRQKGAGIVQRQKIWRAARAGKTGGVEKRAGHVVVLVKRVVDQAEYLDVRGYLIGRMQVQDRVGRNLRVLV